MNLHKALPSKSYKEQKGTTLLEVMLVVMLLGVVLSVVIPVSFRFYYTHSQTETLHTILNTMRTAELAAQYDIHESVVGIKLFPTHIVLFQGDSYALRTPSEDNVIPFESTLTLSGDDEVVFARASGMPSQKATLSFAQHTSTSTVIVSASGLIDQQIQP